MTVVADLSEDPVTVTRTVPPGAGAATGQDGAGCASSASDMEGLLLGAGPAWRELLASSSRSRDFAYENSAGVLEPPSGTGHDEATGAGDSVTSGLAVRSGEPCDRDALIEAWGIDVLPTWIALELRALADASRPVHSVSDPVRDTQVVGDPIEQAPGGPSGMSLFVESSRLVGARPKHEVERHLFVP